MRELFEIGEKEVGTMIKFDKIKYEKQYIYYIQVNKYLYN